MITVPLRSAVSQVHVSLAVIWNCRSSIHDLEQYPLWAWSGLIYQRSHALLLMIIQWSLFGIAPDMVQRMCFIFIRYLVDHKDGRCGMIRKQKLRNTQLRTDRAEH